MQRLSRFGTTGPVALLVLSLAGAMAGGCASDGSTNLKGLRSAAEGVLGSETSSGALGNGEIASGLKQALTIGTGKVVSQLGRSGGFSNDAVVRIPLPSALVEARKVASKFGMGGMFDDLELKLNEAAEAATPKARELFVGAITSMTVSDARGILNGPDDAATSYFRDKTGAELSREMRPIIDNALADVGAVTTFNKLMNRYNAIPGMPAVNTDLTGYVVEKANDGIFHYVAEEEKAIRENPLERSTELLQRVFGSVGS
ncbi:MAG: hypothetical protein CSB44_11280 [Gammaproteobacteria bacterium]|nr:MAG: hypothetical protein CSB44_11280 [Gammaproteobacteria bacterium]